MKHHHLLPSFLVCPQAACYDKNNRMLREEVQMSAKEVWSKYRLALPVFLCLAVAGFIIAMLLRAGRSAEPPMYAVDSSDSRSRPSSQTATRSSTGNHKVRQPLNRPRPSATSITANWASTSCSLCASTRRTRSVRCPTSSLVKPTTSATKVPALSASSGA